MRSSPPRDGARVAEDITTLVGRRIRQLRRERRWTIEELAAAAELDPSYVSRVERGVQNASLTVLAQLARAFSIPVAEVVDVVSVGVSAMRKRATERLAHLDAEQLAALVRVIDALRRP